LPQFALPAPRAAKITASNLEQVVVILCSAVREAVRQSRRERTAPGSRFAPTGFIWIDFDITPQCPNRIDVVADGVDSAPTKQLKGQLGKLGVLHVDQLPKETEDFLWYSHADLLKGTTHKGLPAQSRMGPVIFHPMQSGLTPQQPEKACGDVGFQEPKCALATSLYLNAGIED
jgi:hypothetical protein